MLSTGFIVNFAPETWSFGHRFNKFTGPPIHVDSALRAGVASVLAHQDKYCLLVDIANEFASTLDEDEAELEAHGYTPARRTRSFAALSETMVAEQYAMLDGFRKVVHSIFRTVQGTQDTSTQKLFKRARMPGMARFRRVMSVRTCSLSSTRDWRLPTPTGSLCFARFAR